MNMDSITTAKSFDAESKESAPLGNLITKSADCNAQSAITTRAPTMAKSRFRGVYRCGVKWKVCFWILLPHLHQYLN